jgi:sugar phosphate isomerase/epimerase
MPTANPVAVQLYTLRDTSLPDRPAMLRALAEAGYGAVEPFDVLTDPHQLRAELDAAGLAVSSVHARPNNAEQFDAVVAGTLALGTGTIIVPMADRALFTTREGIAELAGTLNRTAVRLGEHGLRLGYHNHDFELSTVVDGRPALEILADVLDPDVVLEVDTYWAAVGGQDVPALLGRLGDRVRFLHVKDGPATDPAAPMTAVGAPSAEWHIVELDRCATDMLEAVRDSITWLIGQGLARAAA